MRRIVLAITIGVIVGLVIGLFIGWNVAPTQTIESPIQGMAGRFKDDYTVMVADGYGVDGDLNEAIRRLNPLGYKNIPQYVQDITERYISQNGSGKEADIRSLVLLSRALGHMTPPMQPFALPSATPGS